MHTPNPVPYPKELILRELYAIRSKQEPEKFFPETKGSYTHRAPCTPEEITPRLFTSIVSAKSFLTQWKRGRHINYGEDGTEIRHVAGRNPNDYEIIPVAIVFQDYSDT